MAGIIATCPSCSQLNEVDPATVPTGVKHGSCWFCATRFPLVPSGSPPAEALSPFGERYETPAALTERAKVLGRAGPGSSRSRLATLLVVGGVAAVALGVAVALILLVGALGGRGPSASTGQFRAAYHEGTAAPEGTVGWQIRLAGSGGFSLARSAEVVFATANAPRSQDAEQYSPPGVPEDVLPRLREYHGRSLSAGFRPHGQPGQTALQQGQQERFRLALRNGLCYHVRAFAGAGAQDVDLLMYQPDGYSLVVADTRGERDGYVEHCPAAAGEYQLEVRMPRGGGIVVHAAYVESEQPAHDTGQVFALNAADGARLWERALEREVSTSPAYSDGSVVVGTRTERRSKAAGRMLHGGGLVVLSAEDGSERCVFEAEGPVVSSPVVHAGVAFFGACGPPPAQGSVEVCQPGSQAPSKLHAVRVADCAEIWSYAVGHPIVTSPSTDGRRVYFTEGSRLAAVDAATGAISWSHDVRGLAGSPAVRDRLVVFGTEEGVLFGVRADDGQQVWRFDADAAMTAMPALTRDLAFAGASDGTLFAIGLDDGTRQWDYRAPAPVTSPVAVVGAVVYVLAGNHVVGIGVEDGTVSLDLQAGRGFSAGNSPLLVNGTLFVADGDGSLLAIR